jgi:hypothetical protein
MPAHEETATAAAAIAPERARDLRAEAASQVRDLLIDRPLYTKIEGDDALMDRVHDVLVAKTPLEFDLYCLSCGQITPWVVKPFDLRNSGGGAGSRYAFQAPVPSVRALHAVCLRKQHFYTYVLVVGNGTVQKIGQRPSMADIAFAELKDLPNIGGQDRRELGRALGLFAHDTPLGAFVYLRRVFERMIERAHDHYKETRPGPIKNWGELRMGERVSALGDALPAAVSSNAGVFGLLSKGIHELSDEDAEALFPLVKAVIFQMLGDEERHRQAARSRQETDKALQAAIARHSPRKDDAKPGSKRETS